MKTNKTILTLLLGSLLTACGSTPPATPAAEPELIPYSDVCCTQLSQLPFIKLAANETLNFHLNADSDAAAFQDGNSYFSAFEFADRSAIVTVSISSFMIDGKVFAPKMVSLDADFNPVDFTTLEQFDIKTSDAFTKTQYSADFKVDARKTPYIVIYTPEEYLGRQITVDHPAKVRAKELGEAMPMVTDLHYVHSQSGQVSVDVKTLSFQSVKHTAVPVRPASEKEVKRAVLPESKSVLTETQPETVSYYRSSITKAVTENNIPKALGLLEEAKVLGVEGAQQAFVEAVNSIRSKP
ncbi:transcriptional regulator [Vibrio sp. HA2012]|uniref:MalM family protein n=1 Tax=Vibrio sp. HA2012 TaxID=1971595 RepID=UPI000C2B56E4|nr:MalM family protein [Vibrio sp. HA2012]PJC86932.1 transcriptional regulator [Vibrio sp. HA2012]